MENSEDGSLRPADLLLSTWYAGNPTAIDVTVSHGWGASQSSSSSPPPRDNWRPFLRRKEDLKHAKYDDACSKEGWHFSALAIGTWGGLGPEGAKVLSRIVKRCSAWESAETKGLTQRSLNEMIGVALFRQIWRLLSKKNDLC